MKTILIGIFAIYCLPLLMLGWGTIETRFYEGVVLSDNTVATSTMLSMATSIAGDILGTIRDSYSALLIPLMAAYAISTPKKNEKIPRMTTVLFVVFIIFFLVSITHVGLIDAKKTQLISLGFKEEEIQSLYQMVRSFTLESLTYIALLLGITIKKN